MASHFKREGGLVYFCTVTCYKWLPLIEQANAYDSVYRWFGYLKNDGCKLLGYVIMPNHFHVLLYPIHTGTAVNILIGECKRFMAYDIVQALKKQNYNSILEVLEKGVPRFEKRKGKLHQVFKPSFDGRDCWSDEMVEQKLEYMHHNPVRGKWNLVDDFVKYKHSSAAYYEEQTFSEFLTHYKLI